MATNGVYTSRSETKHIKPTFPEFNLFKVMGVTTDYFISTYYKYTTAVTRGGLCAGDAGRTPQCPHPPGVARSHEVGEDPYGARRGERAARLFHAKFVSLEILLLPG